MEFLLNHPMALFAVSFLLLWLSVWAGSFCRSRSKQISEGVLEDYGLVVGATLTLLGLIIGFTFSMATSRYDLRKSLEEEEANAIGTEYVRVDFLPAADAGRLKVLLRQYTDLRIQFYKVRSRSTLNTIDNATASMQSDLWQLVSHAAKNDPNPLAALVAAGMNDVLNSQGYTQAAWWNRIPDAAWAMLYIIAVLANFLIGYGAHGKGTLLSIVLPLIVSISFLLIADIDSPRGGVIRVNTQNLTALASSFKTP